MHRHFPATEMQSITVLTLPYEILDRVFAVSNGDLSRSENGSSLVTLLRVCKLWKAVATPWLYRRLSICFGKTSSDSRRKFARQNRLKGCLLRTLHSKPELYAYVRDLELSYWSDCDNNDKANILEILRKANPYLQRLELFGASEIVDDELLSQVVAMNVGELILRSGWCHPVVTRLLIRGASNRLRKLSLNPYNSSDANGKFTLLPNHKYSSSVEALEFSANWSCESLRNLLLWSNSLKVLRLNVADAFYFSQHPHNIHYRTYTQKLLDLRKDSLEDLELAQFLADDSGSLIELSDYRNLRNLSLHQRNFFETTPEDACWKLLAPMLEQITIDMNWNDQQCAGYTSLSEQNVDWLITFLRLRQKNLPTSMLKHIRIIYGFSNENIPQDYATGYIHDEPWPLSHLEQAAASLAEFGITMSWPKPYLSKAEWENMIRTQTIPGLEDTDTREERRRRQPATEEEKQQWPETSQYETFPEELPSMIEDDSLQKRICDYLSIECRQRH